MRLRAQVQAVRQRLQAAGCASPGLDAALLIGAGLGISREQLITATDRELTPTEVARVEALVQRRERREPVAYILGKQGFRQLDLHVNSAVLVPRPETEFLVEAALQLPVEANVVDIGTGSGAVALAIKSERPDLTVAGYDISPQAIAVARANAQRLGLKVNFAVSDLLEAVTVPIDAVLANLPYIPTADYENLQPEIRQHEPRCALDGGRNGLALVQRLINQCAARQIGFVALEIGFEQAANTVELLRTAEFSQLDTITDLAGIERIVTAFY